MRDGLPSRSPNFCWRRCSADFASASDPLTPSWTAKPPTGAVSAGAGAAARAVGCAEATRCGAGCTGGDAACGEEPPEVAGVEAAARDAAAVGVALGAAECGV